VIFLLLWQNQAFFAFLGVSGALLTWFVVRQASKVRLLVVLAKQSWEATQARLSALENQAAAPAPPCPLTPRLEAIEAWIKEFEEDEIEAEKAAEEAKSEQMRQLAYRSNQVQAERKEMEKAAYSEAQQAIQKGGNNIDAIKDALRGVVLKYPQVAENTAKKLIRDMGFQRYEGIIMPMVAQLAQSALAPKSSTTEEGAGGAFGGSIWG